MLIIEKSETCLSRKKEVKIMSIPPIQERPLSFAVCPFHLF